MAYREYKPCAQLQPYIDAYWRVQSNEGTDGVIAQRILPDGCADLICNLGSEVFTTSGNTVIDADKIFMVGTMTRFAMSFSKAEANLIGIRFKPGAFPLFYNFSMHEVINDCIEFDRSLLDIAGLICSHTFEVLDQYFLKKLTRPSHYLFPVIADIIDHKAGLRIEMLAKKHFITKRQLERNFKQYIGISPKEFSNITRFNLAVRQIRQSSLKTTLQTIAFENGYYDHAHLNNEIKKYSGLTPREI